MCCDTLKHRCECISYNQISVIFFLWVHEGCNSWEDPLVSGVLWGCEVLSGAAGLRQRTLSWRTLFTKSQQNDVAACHIKSVHYHSAITSTVISSSYQLSDTIIFDNWVKGTSPLPGAFMSQDKLVLFMEFWMVTALNTAPHLPHRHTPGPLCVKGEPAGYTKCPINLQQLLSAVQIPSLIHKWAWSIRLAALQPLLVWSGAPINRWPGGSPERAL